MTAHPLHDTPGDSLGPSRRRFLLETAGLGVVGAASACAPEGRTAALGGTGFAFRGARQAGVTTPQQPAALVVSYDLAPHLHGRAGRRAVRDVLARWSRVLDAESAPARLTATVGIGPLLPGLLGVPAPDALREVPRFPGDRLDPTRCGGHVLVQLCADDRRTTEQAGTTLTGLAADTLRPRWRQTGFLSPTPAGQTPRNLLGFKDGTENPTPQECEKWVWAGYGTFLVVRRVHIRVRDFSRLAPRRKEEIIGRHRADGAPLGRRHEHDDVDIFAKNPQGRYVIPLHAHVRAASPRFDGGARMLRRGYSYDNGPEDRGLLFLAFMRDPALFVRVQQRLAERDDLSRFIEHRASAVAYVLPGARAGEDLGGRLLG